jgi:hypothetical protein
MVSRKITMPAPAGAAEESVAAPSQGRPVNRRYLLRVDRQTKTSFDTLDQAETAGRKIKTAFPIVQVSIYDTAMSESTILDSPPR